MYSVLRSMLQQVVFAASSKHVTAFCVSPTFIDANNTSSYAQKIVDLMISKTDLELIDLGVGTVFDLKVFNKK